MRGASFQMTTVDGRDEALEVGKPKARFEGGFLSGMKKAVGLGGGNEAGPYADKLKPASQSEMHGWLHKQGTKVTSWSHRYFVLQGPIFAYFEDEKAAMAADLSKCHGSGLVKSAERWPPQYNKKPANIPDQARAPARPPARAHARRRRARRRPPRPRPPAARRPRAPPPPAAGVHGARQRRLLVHH